MQDRRHVHMKKDQAMMFLRQTQSSTGLGAKFNIVLGVVQTEAELTRLGSLGAAPSRPRKRPETSRAATLIPLVHLGNGSFWESLAAGPLGSHLSADQRETVDM